MSARSVTTPVLVSSITGVLLIVGLLGWYFLGPKTGSAPAAGLSSQEKTNIAWVRQKAKESAGDFTKLSPEDQRQLIALRGNAAPFLLRQEAQRLPSGK